MPERCLVNIGDGLLVASPELCFFQMASKLSFVKLIELGYELCGTYSFILPEDVSADEEIEASRETAYNLVQLTNKKKLTAFVAQMPGKHGKKKATRALKYIIDGSGSPMETILAILLVLPINLGGYGFPLPEMNRRINPKAAMRKGASKQYYKCDLCWKDFNVAVEYDSYLYHSDSTGIAGDSIKRGDLALSGIDVITVTNRQINSVGEFGKVAKQIASKLGRQIQIRNPRFTDVQSELRNQLLTINPRQK